VIQPSDLAAAVVEFRNRHAIKQVGLAKELGIAVRHVQRLESGRQGLTNTMLRKLVLLMKQRDCHDLAGTLLLAARQKDKVYEDVLKTEVETIGRRLGAEGELLRRRVAILEGSDLELRRRLKQLEDGLFLESA
jgi:transcriptional regulator with XRE-family HTH domain